MLSTDQATRGGTLAFRFVFVLAWLSGFQPTSWCNVDDAIKRLEQKIDTLTGILMPAAQAFIIAADGLEKMQAAIDVIQDACTKERPKSELKPTLDKIEAAVTRTADAVEDGMSNLPVVIHAAVDSAFEAREMADG